MMPTHFFRYVGEPRPEDDAYAAALNDANLTTLDPWSTSDENIEAHFVLGGRRSTVELSPMGRDVFDLGAIVYIADEIVPRAAADDRWTRSFRFTVPVADTARWESANSKLVSCLSFLSGDTYALTWMERPPNVPGGPAHRTKLGGNYDAVCLFSGGVDSLLGANMLLSEDKRVLLIGHYADGVTSSAQRDLFAFIEKKYPGRAALLQVNVARSLKRKHRFELPKKAEITHRARSFLFLTAGVAAAMATGTKRLYIPENGLIAVNAPLGRSRQGTLSTRTAHPRYIEVFNDVLSALGIDVRVENPFSYQSKTDMLQSVTDADLREALIRSVSCAHAGNLRWEGDSTITHCGYCVPCLYRRAAFLLAGIEEDGYLYDVFKDLRKMSDDTARDFRLLVRFALSIASAKEVEVMAALLRHGAFSAGPTGDEYTQRAQMLRRWAASFIELARQRATTPTRKIVGL
jgi:7-cyano-7-deazaguanine synthase in queuosine biosynthesis